MQSWSKDEIIAWQNLRLKRLIVHAYHKTEFYKEYFDNNKLHPEDIVDIEQLKLLPVLTKEIIKGNFEKLSAKNKSKFKHKRSATGGSTAEPLVFLRDYDSWSYTSANSQHYWEKIGYKLGDKYAAFGSSNIIPDKKLNMLHQLYYSLKGKISLSGINFNEETINSHVNILRGEKIRFLYGYSSALYLLAKYVKMKNIKLDIRGCISTSELLLADHRELIKDVFGCEVLDAYGAGDGGITAFNYSGKLFEVGYSSILEIDKENDNRILVTDLLNYSMPFIRYEVGDAAESSPNPINDYNGQTIEKLYGRVPNVLRFNNGVELIAPAFTVLFSDVNVDAFRMIKQSERELRVEIKKGMNYSNADEATILSSLKSHVGSDITVSLTYGHNFKLQKSGKRDYFLSC